MKSERGWSGIICCFTLFIIVCFFLLLNKEVAVVCMPGHSELGLLLFLIPGIISGVIAGKQAVLRSILGAVLAVPFCLALIRGFLQMPRSAWQELAWLSSAVFWCALGALCFQFVQGVLGAKRGRS